MCTVNAFSKQGLEHGCKKQKYSSLQGKIIYCCLHFHFPSFLLKPIKSSSSVNYLELLHMSSVSLSLLLVVVKALWPVDIHILAASLCKWQTSKCVEMTAFIKILWH